MKIPKTWSFKTSEVANNFDSHVREQLPWYDLATRLVAHIARHYVCENGLVYDIGASTGNIGLAIEDVLRARGAKIVAIEESREMAKAYRHCSNSTLLVGDACEQDYEKFDLCVCFLSLLFIAPEKRTELLQKLKKATKYGGAIAIFDRTTPSQGYVGIIKTRLALIEKINAGASHKDILEKELSLMGIQRPINESELGEGAIEVFRFGDFAGWVIENNHKPSFDEPKIEPKEILNADRPHRVR